MKKVSTQWFLALFVVLSLTHLFTILLDYDTLAFITKPLLISSLACWFYHSIGGNWTSFSRLFLIGLVFSIMGDTLLMFVKLKGEIFFLMGLGSFLLAHLNYIGAFSKYPDLKSGYLWTNKWAITPFLAILFSLLLFLSKSLGAYLIPVSVYATVIIAMSASSLNMWKRTSDATTKVLFFGAALFVISDLTIALKKFKYPELSETGSSLTIMATYLLGQYFLTSGAIKATRETR